MEAHRIEVSVLVKDEPGQAAAATEPASAHPLRGTPYRYDEPFEPAEPTAEWEATR